MKQSTSQGKSKKQYVPPKVKAHGNVYQLAKTPGGGQDPFGETYGYSP